MQVLIDIKTGKKRRIKIVLTIKLLRIMEMNYVAPELEVLEVMVEKGFAGSPFDSEDFPPAP